MFLGSGLFPMSRVEKEFEVQTSLGTDIGAGTSFSMWKTMMEAQKIAKLQGQSLSPAHIYYLATESGAKHLHFGEQTGTLAKGKHADFFVLDPKKSSLLERRFRHEQNAEQMLSALIHLADDRHTVATYQAGRKVFG
jgi:guanine deaminase